MCTDRQISTQGEGVDGWFTYRVYHGMQYLATANNCSIACILELYLIRMDLILTVLKHELRAEQSKFICCMNPGQEYHLFVASLPGCSPTG